MARVLVLSLDGQEFGVEMQRIDREGLYGTVEIEAFDEKGKPAVLKVLAADGKTLIDKGGTALLMIDEAGNSVSRSELRTVDVDGNELKPVKSSFDGVNELKKASLEDFLSLIVRSVYLLSPADPANGIFDSLCSTDRIYKFPFSYRGGIGQDSAYIVSNFKDVFMTVGKIAEFEFVKLNQPANLDSIEEQEIVADDISFDLM